MSMRYVGGLVTTTVNPYAANVTTSPNYAQYNGVFTLAQQAQAATSGQWCTDPFFRNTTLLLRADGTANASQNNTFLDSSTNNFTITRNGNTTQGTFSPYGNLWSNYFDGSGDRLDVPNNSALQLNTGNFTLEAWIYYTTATAYFHFFSKWNSNDLEYQLQVVTGDGILATNTSSNGSTSTGTTVSSSGAVKANVWQHVAWVRNGSIDTLYVNGVSVASGSAGTIRAGTSSLSFGGRQDGSFYGTGYLSNARLVKGTAVYTSNFTPSTTPLTAVSGTSLLTCQSNRFIDNSSNNFAITVNGNTSVQRFSPFNPTAAYSAATIGGSGYFDGSGDYLTTPSNAVFNVESGNYTVEFWMNLGVVPTNLTAVVASFNSSNGGSFFVGIVSSKLRIITGNDTSVVTSTTTTLLPNVWYHVALVRDGSTSMKTYLNGVLEVSSTSFNWTGSTQPCYIGTYNGGTQYINGYISNLRIVKGTALYTSNFTPPTAPLTPITNTSLLLNFTNAGIADITTQNDLETVGNAQVSTSVVKYGTGSLYFDGSGDYLMMPNSQNFVVGTGDFTIENWVYHTTAAGSLNIYFAHQGSGISFYRNSSGKLEIAQDGVAALATSTNNIPINSWVHVAAARSGTSLKLFINGTQEASVTNSTNLTGSGSAGVGSTSTNLFPLTGYIDDLRITKGVARYISNFTPPPVALPVQ